MSWTPFQVKPVNPFLLDEISKLDIPEQVVAACLMNPGLFCKYILATEIFPFQAYTLACMYNKAFPLLVGNRGFGKSFLLALYAVMKSVSDQGSKTVLISKSYRQCLTGDALLFTRDGFVFFDKMADAEYVFDGYSFTKRNEFWENEEAQTIKIITSNGYEIEGKPDHKININGQWIKLSDIREGDKVYLHMTHDIFSNNSAKLNTAKPDDISIGDSVVFPEEMNEGLAWLIGKVVTGKCVHTGCKTVFTLNKRLYAEIARLIIIENFNITPVIYSDKDSAYCSVESNALFLFFKQNGFDIRERDTIPDIVLRSNKSVIASFLRSVFDQPNSVKIPSKTVPTVSTVIASSRVAKAIQTIMLNFGIVINRRVQTNGKQILTTVGRMSAERYYNNIGFDDRIIAEEFKLALRDFYPYKMRNHNEMFIDMKLRDVFYEADVPYRVIGDYCHRGRIPIDIFRDILDEYEIDGFDEYKNYELLIEKVIKVEKSKAVTYDIEVDITHRYFANGFINHNSLLIFDEIIKIYHKSPIIKSISSTPSRGTIEAAIKIGESSIKAVPLGEGDSVRGLRATTILVDEFASLPEEIFQVVVRNFAAVSGDPVTRVKIKAMIKKLLAEKKPIPPELRLSSNQIILSGTAWYEDNHYYKTYKKYRNIIESEYSGVVGEMDMSLGGDEIIDYKDYIVLHYNYTHLPDGYIDEKQLSQARMTMSKSAFNMEWLSMFQSNSDGFFKWDKIKQCYAGGANKFHVEIGGSPDAKYVLGFDPSSGGNEAVAGYVVLKLTPTGKQIVHVGSIEKYDYPTAIKKIKMLLKMFNIVGFGIDAGGGGMTIRDLLRDKRIMGDDQLILEEGYEGDLEGRKIIEMINFTPTWILKANQDLQADIDHNRIWFPAPKMMGGVQVEDLEVQIDELVKELLSIEMTIKGSGTAHFDVPSKVTKAGGVKRVVSQRKDRYSALLIANQIANKVSSRIEKPKTGRYDDGEFIGGWAEEFVS